MKRFCLMLIGVIWVLAPAASPAAGEIQISDSTQECLDCHSEFLPGIVQDWRNSRHAKMTPKKALTADKLKKRMSSTSVPEVLQNHAVGCAECHTLRAGAHSDTFEHNGYKIHLVVSPEDCAVCHVTESTQFAKNIMAHAYGNLAENPLYQDLQRTILGKSRSQKGKIQVMEINHENLFSVQSKWLVSQPAKSYERDGQEGKVYVILLHSRQTRELHFRHSRNRSG